MIPLYFYITYTHSEYLLYTGWCILDLDANAESLAFGGEDGHFHLIDADGDLEGRGIYLLIPQVCILPCYITAQLSSITDTDSNFITDRVR